MLHAIQNAANAGAFGFGKQTRPTEAQMLAGNYAKGRANWNGLTLVIEQPRGTYREGKGWRTLMAAHYGYIAGTRGNDGDEVDCFIGSSVGSTRVYVVNQVLRGRFDEHKVMLCYDSEEAARDAYLRSYSRGWTGLDSIAALSLSQFKWWLKNGDLTKPLSAENLPYEGTEPMNRVYWTDDAEPIGQNLDTLLYGIRQHDGAAGLMLDSVSVADIHADPDNEEVLSMDAMVTPFNRLQPKMNVLQAVMARSGGEVKPVAVQVSEPFKQRGTVNVAAVFELSDGQTVTVYFHNPDSTPAKLAPGDELISWKWLLNKKDVTIVVAPERGQDLNIREVARRLMRLAEKNSPAFQRANAKRSERMAAIQSLTDEVAGLEATLASEQNRLDVVRLQAQERAEKKASEDANKPPAVIAKLADGTEGNSINKYLTGILSEIETVRADLDVKGVAYPSPDQFMEDVNAGNRAGFSIAKIKASLAENESTLADLMAGKTTPRKVGGTGSTKASASAWLNERIAEDQQAIASGGFLISTNARNYLGTLRTILRTGVDDGFTSDEQRAKEAEDRAKAEAARAEEQARIEALASENREYEVGSYDEMKQPLHLYYSIPASRPEWVAKLAEAATAEEKFQFMQSTGLTFKGMESFAKQIDYNRARKNGVEFSYFSIAPRKGTYSVEFIIDLQEKVSSAIYEFKNALTGFDAWIQGNPAMLATAIAMDKAAIAVGARVQWFKPVATMDSAYTLDSGLTHAIAALAITGAIAANNAPIHAAEGNPVQAALSAEVAMSAEEATKVLEQYEAGELVAIKLMTMDAAGSAQVCGAILAGDETAGVIDIDAEGAAMAYADNEATKPVYQARLSGDDAAQLVTLALAAATKAKETAPAQPTFAVGDYLTALFPSLNKQPSIEKYKERPSGTTSLGKVEKVLSLTAEEYDEFANNLMASNPSLGGGGSASDHPLITDDLFKRSLSDWTAEQQAAWRTTSYVLVTVVQAPGRETFVVDSQGYDYARYVGLNPKPAAAPVVPAAPTPDPVAVPDPDPVQAATGIVDGDDQPVTTEAAQKAAAIVAILVNRYGFTKSGETLSYGIGLNMPRSHLSMHVGVDRSTPTILEIEGEFTAAEYSTSDTPEQIAAALDMADFAELYGDYDAQGNLIPTITNEESIFFGKPLPYALAAMRVEEGASKVGASVHYGDFNGSTSGVLSFDGAPTGTNTVIGITAQIHSAGQVWARADISEAGDVVLLKGTAGSEEVAKPDTAQQVADALSALIDAWGKAQAAVVAERAKTRRNPAKKKREPVMQVPTQENPDAAILRAIVDGATDPLTADLEALEAIYERNADNAEIQALFEQAVNVVIAAENKATASV